MTGEYHFEDEVHERSYSTALMKRLLGYVKPYKGLLAVAVVLLLIATAVSTTLPFVNMLVIDNFIDDPGRQDAAAKYESSGAQADKTAYEDAVQKDTRGLNRFVSLMALLIGVEMLSRYAQMLLITLVGQKTMLDMRMTIFKHLQRLSLRFLDKNPVGRLMTRVTNDVENIQQTIVNGLVQVVGDLFTIMYALGFMIWLNWRLTTVALSTLPAIFIVTYFFGKYARRSYLETRKKIARVNAHMQENVSGMRTVQVFNHEGFSFDEFTQRNAEHRDEWLRLIRYFALYFPVIDFLSGLSIALIVLFGGRQILIEHSIAVGFASIGMLNAYIQWAERMFTPVRALADKYNMLLGAMASSERVFNLLDTPEEIKNKPGAVTEREIKGEIRFENVTFAYEKDNPVLKNVDFAVAPGERVAIVGHTGAGKTTIISLLSRFYDVQHGRITLDGVDIRDYDKDFLRSNIGVVLQDVFLFSGSVERNIRLGDDTLSGEWIRRCAEYVNAARFIKRLPGEYQYDVGERGANLSTGQRQLLAFARTLAHNPRILVLDEATSSVDTETEILIQDAILKLMKDRTSIVIAHRLSTVQHADRIIVMHHGEIREVGTHQELLAQRGLYYTLYRLQYKDQVA